MKIDPRLETTRKLLFAGMHGHVAALDKETGTEVWRTSLPKSGYGVVSILHEEGRLLCGAGGHVFALDPESGEILWHNGMPNLGHDMIFLATVSSSAGGMLSILAAQAAAAKSSS